MFPAEVKNEPVSQPTELERLFDSLFDPKVGLVTPHQEKLGPQDRGETLSPDGSRRFIFWEHNHEDIDRRGVKVWAITTIGSFPLLEVSQFVHNQETSYGITVYAVAPDNPTLKIVRYSSNKGTINIDGGITIFHDSNIPSIGEEELLPYGYRLVDELPGQIDVEASVEAFIRSILPGQFSDPESILLLH